MQGEMSYSAAQEPAPKRRKVQQACTQCRSRKRRCTGVLPCALCLAQKLECSFGVCSPTAQITISSPRTSRGLSTRTGSTQDEFAPSNLLVAAVENNVTISNDISRSSRAPSVSGEGTTETGSYIGPTSTFSFLRRAWRRFDHAVIPETTTATATDTSIFQFGDRRVPDCNSEKPAIPDQTTIQSLLGRYFNFTAPTYRFLHEPTARSWAVRLCLEPNDLSPAKEAIVLTIIATASLFMVDGDGDPIVDPLLAEDRVQDSEKWFRAAQRLLPFENGKVRLESVQARLAGTMYLLNTSRPNEAWFQFGTAWQLAVALGIHRSRSLDRNADDAIIQECKKRALWAAYTLDTYLSVMLGRPMLITEHGIDQKLPELVNDENLTARGIISPVRPKDCPAAAPIFHAELARIVREAAFEQHRRNSNTRDLVESARRWNREITEWQVSLPPFLSGKIHPSSLVALFRRQQTVLQIASAHATMIVNRTFVIRRIGDSTASHELTERCVAAAKLVLDMLVEMVASNGLFPAFYNTQYVTFVALSVAYVWIIQQHSEKTFIKKPKHSPTDLFTLAESVRKHLAAATKLNAPNLRYSIVLEQLQQEARTSSTILQQPVQDASAAIEGMAALEDVGFGWDDVFEESLGEEFWQQLDMFPFSGGA